MDDDSWLLGGERDPVSITADWTPVSMPRIDGVEIREVRNVPTGYGHLTELFRADWGLDPASVGQVFQSVLEPGRLSAWHAHGETTDRLFVSSGLMLIVLFDARPESPTHGRVMVLRASIQRPQLVVVPPRVWHGVKNIGSTPATLVNIVDVAYRYDGPDHNRLPEDSDRIPFDIVGRT
jgi:dTDP-4-dehydrorhamnose 3,5-epimerase